MGKWLLVIIILIISIIASTIMLQSMGVIDLTDAALNRLEAIPAYQVHATVYRKGLDVETTLEEERLRYSALEEELEHLRAERITERAELADDRKALEKEWALIEQKERQLQARQETLDAQTANLRDIQRLRYIYEEMRPEDLIPIFDEMDESIVANLLSDMDERVVGAIFQAMTPDSAARISKIIGGLSSK